MKKQKMFFCIMLLLTVVLWGCGKKEVSETEKNHSSENVETSESFLDEKNDSEEVGVKFPIIVEDGKLEIESLFSFEGINPDADNATGEDIAAISVKNLSGMYLEEAKITVLANEEELQFAVTDLPEGSSANAFSIDNAMLESSFICDDVKCEAVFKDNELGIPEQITVEENGTQISVTNNSEQELSKVTIYCRCPFEEEYFGGIAYQYEIQGLATGETKLVNAEDFFLGIVEVVRVEVE